MRQDKVRKCVTVWVENEEELEDEREAYMLEMARFCIFFSAKVRAEVLN